MTTRKSSKTKPLSARLAEMPAAAVSRMHEAIDFLGTEPRKVVRRWRRELDRAGRKLSRRIETVAETVSREARRRAAKVLGPVTTRFDVASRTDIDRLRKRLERLEKRLGRLAAPPPAGSAH